MDYRSLSQATSRGSTQEIDQGLREYMLGIYNKMTMALAVTGVAAWWGSTALLPLMGSPIWLLIALSPLAFILVLSFGMYRLGTGTVNVLFWTFSVVMGLSLSTIFVRFTGESVAQVFFITAGTFAAASLYGYVTKKDLTSVGSFLIMGVIGLLIASLVNIFLASSMLAWIISVIGVVVFTGLTAYDTQKLKEDYLSNGEVYGFDSMAKSSIYGALTLYLDFINIFVSLLQLIGVKRE
jgi:FtsH-binding integral membrane protein